MQSQYTKNKVYGFHFIFRILHEKISDLSLLFCIILFIIDELVKGINIREVVVRMRSSLHVRQQTIAHGQCFGVGGCFRHWDGF